MLGLLLAAQLSAVQLENAKPGSPDWEIVNVASDRDIEGYASSTSVNGGDAIDLFISTRDPRYTIDVYRMGWYAGAGARRVAGPIERSGFVQDMPKPDPSTGLLECRWREPLHLETRDGSAAWTSGVYLARLTAHPSGKQSFIVFVVRDDRRSAAIVFQSSVTTFAAYNNWGGASLYAFNSTDQKPARKVSFDRPYAVNPYGVRLDGAGDFLRRWEYNAVRFLEHEGADVKYITDVDTHETAMVPRAGGDGIAAPKIFLSVGHDEYWSVPMRDHVQAARDAGVHLAFLGAGACFWRIRFEPNGAGTPNRTVVSYKEAAGNDDPVAIDANPQNDRLVTARWRDSPSKRPEESLIGVMYAADPVDGDMVVDDASQWAYEGTNVRRGTVLSGLLGYEVDAMTTDEPHNRIRLAHSPFVDQGRTRYADATIYTAGSGAIVFAIGSMQWNWGLDGYNAPTWHADRVNAVAQRVTRNVLDRMLQTQAHPSNTTPGRTRGDFAPSWIVIAAAVVGAVVVLRAWLTRA
ncbi:MAG TPA: N,N-dimethylformamidase beta subunit family domain-containing protein [Rhodanobacteraceae bacterium]